MKSIAIRCKGIKKHYGKGENRVDALKGIDLDIEQGKLTLLVGPSGSGKTTLLSIITTILTPDEGQLFLLEHETHLMSEREKVEASRTTLGIVFQSFFLIPTLTAVENVTLPLLIAGYAQQTATEKAMETLRRLNIAERSHSPPTSLSKGQQQRVAIARAMVHDPQIIVCDEPTSALDQAAGFEIMTLLKELVVHSSKTVLIVTHDQRTFSFADRIVQMSDGLIVKGQGT